MIARPFEANQLLPVVADLGDADRFVIEIVEADFPWMNGSWTPHRPDTSEVPEFLLHTEGADAWFRWSDEPFSEGGTADA